MPLEPSPRRVAIAEAVWWNGPAWTILRNGPQFVRQVLDFGNDDEIAFIYRDVAREVWVAALNEARPGRMSRQAWLFWSIHLGLVPIDYICDWPRDAHIRDIRPLAGATREQLLPPPGADSLFPAPDGTKPSGPAPGFSLVAFTGDCPCIRG